MEAPFRYAEAKAAFEAADNSQFAALGIVSAADPQTDAGRSHDGTSAETDREAEPSPNLRKGAGIAAFEALQRAGHAQYFSSLDGKLWVQLRGIVYRIDETKGCRPALAWLASRGHVLVGNAKADMKDRMVSSALAGPSCDVFFRQANGLDRSKPETFLNLMEPGGNGVHVDASGWRVQPLSTFPVRMTNREHALPLPRPVRAGDGVGFFERLGRHIRLSPIGNAADPYDRGIQQRAVILMTLCAQVYRPGAVPHLLLSGPQGASKTTTARRLKALVDPDTADVVTSLPDKPSEVYAIAEQQTLIVMDNISSVRDPDLLSALATGAASQQRELYSNGGRIVFRATTSVIMTTVLDDITKRPDLMDRILRLDLSALDRNGRKTAAELKAGWDTDLPYLLADLLDLVSGGMARLDATKAVVEMGLLPPLPRLADAALLAEAAAEVAGWAPGVLLAAINGMREGEATRQLDENPVAARIRQLLEAEGGAWSGSMRDLMDRVRFLDGPEGPEWGRAMGSVSAFTNAIDRTAGPMFEAWGVELVRSRSHGARRLTLTRPRH